MGLVESSPNTAGALLPPGGERKLGFRYMFLFYMAAKHSELLMGQSMGWGQKHSNVHVRPKKKKKFMLPSPDQNLKIGSVGRFERVEFSNIFFLVSKWGKLGWNAVKTHIYKCFFKPLNTNFSKFFAQI